MEYTEEELLRNPDLLRLLRKSKEEKIVQNIEAQYNRI